MLRDVKFVNKELSAEFEVPELQKMSYSRRVILMKGTGVFKRRRRYPSSTNTVFENSLPQQLLARKRRRIHNIIRHKPTGNKLSSIVLFIFLIILLLQIINSCDLREILTENEAELSRIADLKQRAQTYLAQVYRLAEKPLRSFHDRLVSRLTGKYADPNDVEERKLLDWKPQNDSSSKKLSNQNKDKEADGSLNSGGTVGANLINTAVFNNGSTSTNIFNSLSNYVEPNPKIVNPIRDQKVACIMSAPKGSDAGISCTSKLLCWLFGGRPKGPCVLGTTSTIGPVRAFDEIRYKDFWQKSSAGIVGSPSSFILSVKTKNRLLEMLSEPICKIRLKFVSFSITQLTCIKPLPNSGSTTVVPIACSGKGGKNTHFDFLSSPVNANDVQLMFDFVAGTNISWNIVMLPCRSFYLVGSMTRQINSQTYTVCFRTELISEKTAEKMNLPVDLINNGGDDFSIIKTKATNVDSALAFIQAHFAAVAAAAAAVPSLPPSVVSP